jgi:signal transduction histidine kinase
MSDTLESIDMLEADGLARRIAVAGLQVSQAADELQQAAERLMNAEELARDAETRAHVAEGQLEQGATKNAELLEMLQKTREDQSDADERSRRSEDRLRMTVERNKLLEDQLTDLEGKLVEAEQQPQVTVIVDQERTDLQEAVAAEVRRPLTSILGLTLALKHADTSSPDGREMVRQLATNARKLDRLVGEMLDVDRIVSGTFTPNRRRTDLEAMVRRVVEDSPDLANRDVRIETAHIAAEVDPGLTEQMVETLLANASRRTGPGNTVWVKVSASEQGGAVIAVDDTGADVPAGLRHAMFEAMQERPGTDRRAKGSTGLCLLGRLAELHGGKAWVEERPGGGSSFRVFLPDVAQHSDDLAPQADREAFAFVPDEDAEEDLFPGITEDEDFGSAAIADDNAIAI